MPSDLSRLTFDPKKHYSSVRLQQGRVLLDADWNEQSDIQQYRSRTESQDVIGKTGVPKEKVNSFLIDFQGDDLSIQPGRIYVGGLLCELDTEASYFNQPYYPNPDNQHFGAITYPFLSPPASPPFSPPESPPGSPPEIDYLEAGTYLIYLDAWEREINHLDDPGIQEVALGEADTTTRLQTVWQVRVQKVEDDQTLESTWAKIIKTPSGKLSAHASELEQSEDPCILPAGAGYRRLENQLYRVEIHRGGDWGTATIKWSRDNATVETKIESINTIEVDEDAANAKSDRTLVVADVGKDAVLGFAGGQWVEIVDEEDRLNQDDNPDSQLFVLLQIASVDPANREIVLKDVPTSVAYKKGLKLRRWDMPQEAAATGGLPISETSIRLEGGVEVQVTESNIKLEGGIEVQLTDSNYRRGDYWLIPARTATGDIEWPKTEAENGEWVPASLAPVGVQHQYCKLATLRVDADSTELPVAEDCRAKFPALTAITAADVAYDSGNCIMHSATTVQEALDNLCQVGNSIYTHIAIPGPGWERIFEDIEEGTDAHIGFPVGEYPLEEPVRISALGNIKLTGSGISSHIIAANSESALIFENCESVTIEHLSATTGLAGYLTRNKGLNGTLTFLSCKNISINHASLNCGVGAIKSATCLTVKNSIEDSGNVRIQNSKFTIGYFQQGILLINLDKVWIEGNSLNVQDWSPIDNMSRLLEDKTYRAEMRSIFISHFSDYQINPTNYRIFIPGIASAYIKTHSYLRDEWPDLIRDNPPEGIISTKDFMKYLDRLIDKILLHEEFRILYPRFNSVFSGFPLLPETNPMVAYKGITVAGQTANEIYIKNNSIASVLQGIHIGFSYNDESDNLPGKAVYIADNNIEIVLPAVIHKTERHGIFVSNCDNISIENNSVLLNRAAEAHSLEVDGIIARGRIGHRLLIVNNYVYHNSRFYQREDLFQMGYFTNGIRVRPIFGQNSRLRIAVAWNYSFGANEGIFVFPDDRIILEHNIVS